MTRHRPNTCGDVSVILYETAPPMGRLPPQRTWALKLALK